MGADSLSWRPAILSPSPRAWSVIAGAADGPIGCALIFLFGEHDFSVSVTRRTNERGCAGASAEFYPAIGEVAFKNAARLSSAIRLRLNRPAL